MSSTPTGAQRPPSHEKPGWLGLRSRASRIAVSTVALAVALTGATVPAAHAVPLLEGDLVFEKSLADAAMLYTSGITANPTNGDIYVTDRLNDKVLRFNSAGTLLNQRGATGKTAGNFDDPLDVAVSPAGDVYVLDTNNNRVQKFTSALVYVKEWGTKGSGLGQFNTPQGIAVDPATGNVLVADTQNHRIQTFGPDGGFPKAWGTQGQGLSQLSAPGDIAVTAGGAVMVADTGNNRIKTFTSTGSYVTFFGSKGTEAGQFVNPMKIAIEKSGDIVVADTGNNRLQRFSSTGASKDAVTFANSIVGVGVDPSTGRVFGTDGTHKTIVFYRNATAPTVDTCPTASGIVGKAYTSEAKMSGFPKATLSLYVGTLPNGLGLLAGGTISGTPTKAGTFSLTLKASNGVTTVTDTTKKCEIKIDPAPAAPVMTQGPTALGQVGETYTSVLAASGYPAPKFTVTGTLPPGLSFAGDTISGTPTKLGVYTVTVQASNGILPNASKQYQITIKESPAIVNGPKLAAQVGVTYSSALQANGYPASSFSVVGTLPPGLGLAGSTISGTPTQAGSFTFKIKADNGAPPAAVEQYTVVVEPKAEAPAIGDGPATKGVVGEVYNSMLTASGYPKPNITVIGSLPPGLVLAGNSISGTPATPGSYPVKVQAENGVTPIALKSYTIVISPAPEAPKITSDLTSTGTVGTAYSSKLFATGYPAPTFSVDGKLPPGLTLNGSTVSGTPAEAGTFEVSIRASNGVDPEDAKLYTIKIAPKPEAPKITKGPKLEGVVGLNYVSILEATGVPAVSSFEKIAGELPPGVTLDGDILSGLPTTPGTYTFALRASNGVAPAAAKEYTVKIAAVGEAPSITVGPKSEGVVGNGYVSVLKATGFPSDVKFSLAGGDLPPGLKLSGSTISGTPSQAGKYAIAIQAENEVDPADIQEFEITIAAVGQAPAMKTGPKTEAIVGNGYVSVLEATGFPAVTEFTKSAGELPPGLELSGKTISGTPSKAGTYAFAIRAENGVNPAAVKEYTITVGAQSIAPTLTQGPKSEGVVGLNYTSVLKASGFPTPSKFEIASGELPPGLTLKGDTVSGVPSQAGEYLVSIRAENGIEPAGVKEYSISIAAVGVAPVLIQGPKTEGTVGAGYVSVLKASGFPTPTAFEVYAGALPPGLELKGDTISGTPSKAGSYAIGIRASNGVAPAAVQEYSITIYAGEAPQFVVGPTTSARVGIAYVAPMNVSGAPAPELSLAAGSTLPAGVKLVGSTLSGRPTTAGAYTFTLEAKNGIGAIVKKDYTITVRKAITKMTAKFSTKHPTARKTTTKLSVKVYAPSTVGVSKNGTIRVYYNSQKVKTVKMYHSYNGHMTFKLPKFTKKGKNKVTIRYSGNSKIYSSRYATYVHVH